MSSTRLNYDNCELNQSDIQRVDVLNYHMFKPKYNHHESCKKTNNLCHLTDIKRTEIENNLMQLGQQSGKCDNMKYKPPCDNPTNCEVSNNGFTPMRVFSRDVVWTNLKKPTNTGLQKL